MGFFGYLLLGSIVYIVGSVIHQKVLKPKQTDVPYNLKHPLILQLLMGCFVVMLIVSVLLGRFVMGHEGFDWAFIVVNSLVATVIFYFAINPDQTMNLPH